MSSPPTNPMSTVREWHATLGIPAISTAAKEGGIYLSRYSGSDAEMHQPALADHILCMHLGGDKQVLRSHHGRTTAHPIGEGMLTIMPAEQANRWLTRGPIDFAHLVISPVFLNRLAIEEFDLEPGDWALADSVGLRDLEIVSIYRELLRVAASKPLHGRLYPESLLAVLAAILLSRHAAKFGAAAARPPLLRGGLPEWRLRRVLDFMAAHIAEDIGLEDLTAASGLTRAQFFRAFRQSTGASPYRYLSQMRIDEAGALLRDTKLGAAEAAQAVGLRPGPRFSAAIRRRFGAAPRKER